MVKLFKSKRDKKDEFLLKEFEEGRILHIDDQVDNKEIFKIK